MTETIPRSSGGLIEVEALRAKLAETERKLAEAQEVIRAIQSGDVDAVVVSGPDGEQIFTLKGAEYAYRALVEAMNEGAATLDADGVVLYCNQRLADLLGVPLEQVIGKPSAGLFARDARRTFGTLLAQALCGEALRAQVELYAPDGRHIPAYVSLREMKTNDPAALCMVVTDLTENKRRDELIAAGKVASSILESAAEAIAVCDETGRIIMGNAALEELCGCNPLFQPFENALPLEVRQEPDARFRLFSISAALAGTVFRTHEVWFRRKDGRTFSLLLSSGRIAGESGVAGVVLTMTDITERKRAEDELRKAEERFRVAQELSPDGFTILRPIRDDNGRVVDFTVLYQNAAMSIKAADSDPSEIVGRRLLEVFPSQRGSKFFTAYQHVAESGERLTLEEQYSGENFDRSIWFRITVVPVNGEIAVQAQDLTERKLAEDALRESEARFRSLFDNSPDAVLLTIPNGDILAANPAACTMFGMSEAEICRAGRQRLVDTNDPRYVAAEEERQRTNRAIKAELTFIRGSGELFPGEMDSVILPGHPVRSFVVIREITERKLAEQALIQSEKLASVGRMASTIAHEINNPLETIGHVLYLAATDPGTSREAKSYLDIANQEMERITHITRQTLAFHRESKIPATIDLRETLEGILRLFTPRLKSRGIAIEKRYAEVARINAAAGEIQQIVSNLLSNSMDAMTNPGKIVVHLSPWLAVRDGSARVRLTIADTGSGIPPERLKKIFDAFFTTKEMVGTGLGLWVTKQIVEKHGATVRVRSKPGHGTVFSIVFPSAEGNTKTQ